MAYAGPKGVFRGLRKIAIEKGTSPQGFDPEIPYNTQGGHPIGPGMPMGTYECQIPAITPDAKPVEGPKSFDVKK